MSDRVGTLKHGRNKVMLLCGIFNARTNNKILSRTLLKINLKSTYNAKQYTVKPVFNGPFIKRDFVLNGNIFRSRDYHSIP
jgi:hypothetical protein